MNLPKKASTTHVIFKFNEKTKHGKEIDVIPILWTYFKKGKFEFENEYHKLDEMSKTSSIPDTLWKSFEITLIKEAGSYLSI